jgi:hypothetical protein
MNDLRLAVFNTEISQDEAVRLIYESDKSFSRALSGIRLVVPEFIENMCKLSYKELREVELELFKERHDKEEDFKKEGTLILVNREVEYIDYESSQCLLDPEEHSSIGKKPYDDIVNLKYKIGGLISWRLYLAIANNEKFHTDEQYDILDLTNSNSKLSGDIVNKDNIADEKAESSDVSEVMKSYKELVSTCRSDEYKDIFGNLIISDPLAITLNETALNLAQKSDSSLEKIIDRCTDGEKESLVKYEKLELRLRKQFYEIYQGESVKGILFRCIKDKHSLNRFGRGRVIVWPLEVIYRLQQKEKEFYQNKKEEVKEIPDNDMVNKPKHYMFNVDGHDVQAIDLVKGLLTPEEFRGWIKGSYFTYLMRADRKNGIEDLEKARTFLNWQIQLDKGEELTLPGKK